MQQDVFHCYRCNDQWSTDSTCTPTVTTADPATCATPTGTITVTAPLGAGLSYSIDGVDYTNTTGIFNGVAPGTYNVTVQMQQGVSRPQHSNDQWSTAGTSRTDSDNSRSDNLC
jgi:hypothetical protein